MKHFLVALDLRCTVVRHQFTQHYLLRGWSRCMLHIGTCWGSTSPPCPSDSRDNDCDLDIGALSTPTRTVKPSSSWGLSCEDERTPRSVQEWEVEIFKSLHAAIRCY